MGTTIPVNSAAFELDELVACVDGELLQKGTRRRVVGICTDSRHIRSHNAFVALAGERFDGHDHIAGAAESGASVLIVSRPVLAPAETSVVLVGDTLEALGCLGRDHRRRWAKRAKAAGLDGCIVAITGSAGKTTTCRAATAALEAVRPGDVQSPAGNLNNAIGVPLVLLGLEDRHGQAVVEVGTNSPGEIAYGAGLVEPDVSVLTLVACAHTEGLGSIEAVAKEKGALFAALGADGVCVANADDPQVISQIERTNGARVITFGRGANADVRVVDATDRGWQGQDVLVRVRVGPRQETVAAKVPLLGAAGVYATSAALAVAWAACGDDIDFARAAEGLSGLQAESGRLRPRSLPNGAILIDDAYNANPASMRDSIDVAAQVAKKQGRGLVLVLGEMRELGAQSQQQHRGVGQQVAQIHPDLVVVVGDEAKCVAEVAGRAGVACKFAPDALEAAHGLIASVGDRDVILVKGSRGVALERVVEALDVWGQGRGQ